jgi:RNase P subunit RPR2
MPENDADPTVPIVCPECDTETRIPISKVADSLDQHNERLHDGEEIARVDPAIAEQLANVVAEDLGLL